MAEGPLQRDGFLYVPPGQSPIMPAPLLVLLHGGTRSAEDWWPAISELVDARGVVVLAPDSRDYSWDAVIHASLDRDVAFLDRALAATFRQCLIDPSRIWIGGFSDGGGEALAVGLSNGDLFSAIAAFSPSIFVREGRVGSPRVFVSHGRADLVINVGQTRDDLVPALRSEGLAVTYVEYDGGHNLPMPVAHQAMDWLTRR